jgi:hypothetical protein
MFGFIKKLFGAKPAEVTAEVPYKVEAPTVTEVVNSQPVVKEVAPVAEKVVKPAKKPATKKAPVKAAKPAKAPAKKSPKKAK